MSAPVRILAIGDSLTAGYYNSGLNFHPYSLLLTSLFSSIGVAVQFDEKGISGEQVVPWMRQRLERILEETAPSTYDWTLILGGTNDLGWRRPAEHIFQDGLKLMYDRVLQTRSQLVIMTVMEMEYEKPGTRGDKRREDLNDFIRGYAQKHAEKDRILLVDLAQEIPYHRLTDPQERNILWDDGVHLTPAGYDQMAQAIFRTVKQKFVPCDSIAQ